MNRQPFASRRNFIAAPSKGCILIQRNMNQRRPRPSAPVNDRVEEVPRTSDWVSPWSLDPDLPPQRRPVALSLNDPSKGSTPAMPPPSLSVAPKEFHIEPLPDVDSGKPIQREDPSAIQHVPVSPASPSDSPEFPPNDLPPSEPNLEAEIESSPLPTPMEENNPGSNLATQSPPANRTLAQPKTTEIQARSLPSFPTARQESFERAAKAITPKIRVMEPDQLASEGPKDKAIPAEPESFPSEPAERAKEPPHRDRASIRRGEPAHPGISWGTLISLSLGLLGFSFVTWLYLHDIKPEDDADLHIDKPVDVTPIITAPERLQVFLNSIEPIQSRNLASMPPSNWDTPSLSRFVQSNGPALDNLKDLLEDPDWHPRHSAWHDIDLGSHRSWTNAALLKQAEAAYHARLQQEEPAYVAAIDLAELARRLEEMWAWPSFAKRSLELHERAAQTLAELLRKTRLPDASLAQFQGQYEDCKPDTQTLVRACNAFFIHEKKLLLGAASGEPLDTMPGGMLNRRPTRLLFKTNETLALFADAMRLLKAETAEAPFSGAGQAAEVVRRTRKEALVFYQPNAAGQTYFCDRMETYLNFPSEHTLARTRHGLVQILFATRRNLAASKRLPGSLLELVPTYLSDLPSDPFSGEAFIFNPLRGLIHSIGDNFTNEDGMITDPQMNDPGEPTVQIGVAAAAVIR